MGYLTELNLDNFTAVSIDNIDFLQRHSFVFCGDQSRSWHGTTIQVVQPLPATAQIATDESMDTAQTSESIGHSNPEGQVQLDSVQAPQIAESTGLSNPDGQVQLSHKRTERPAIERSPTLTTKSPAYKKNTRRSRSSCEGKGIQPTISHPRRSLFSSSSASSLTELSYNHYTPLKTDHDIKEFHLTDPEEKELKKFEEMAFLYIVHRYHTIIITCIMYILLVCFK